MKLPKSTLVCALVAAFGIIIALPQAARAQGTGGIEIKTGNKFKTAFRDSVAPVTPSTVRICCDGKETALGVVVKESGYILTKASDLKGAITVKFKDGTAHEVRWVGHHEPNDLAMLKLDSSGASLKPIVWADSKVCPVGNFVASVGQGIDPVAVGVMSVAARKVPAERPLPVPGSAYLGIALKDVPKGVQVMDVTPDTAASKAKIKVDDVIVALGDKEIRSSEVLVKTLSKLKAGDAVQLRLLRGDEEMELKVTLGKRPPDRSDMQNNMGSKLSNRRSGFPVIIQHDSIVLPEDCGGPLCDLEGRVIGINISRAGRVETFAIPSEVIRPLLPDLMSGKLAPKKD